LTQGIKVALLAALARFAVFRALQHKRPTKAGWKKKPLENTAFQFALGLI